MNDTKKTERIVRPTKANPLLEFFRGWRRKVGCVTLLMACAVFGIAMRSFVVGDQIAFKLPILNRQHVFYSFSGQLEWVSFDGDLNVPVHWFVREPGLMEIYWDQFVSIDASREGFTRWTISYLFLALPLTLLSAYLILGKPPSRKTPNRG